MRSQAARDPASRHEREETLFHLEISAKLWWRDGGGFQHAIVEFARNVLGLEDADHAGTNPQAERLVITPLACSLVGIEQRVKIIPGTRAARLYGAETTLEDYRCNYGVNPAYHEAL